MPMLVSQDGETLFSNTPSLPSENAKIEQSTRTYFISSIGRAVDLKSKGHV